MPDTKLKLLVVDDVEDIREFFESYFKRRGFSVLGATSAEEALVIIKEENPDILLLDFNLPEMNGIELLKIVRQFNKTIKVVMVTGSDVDSKDAVSLERLNVLGFLHKPVGLPELESFIKQLTA